MDLSTLVSAPRPRHTEEPSLGISTGISIPFNDESRKFVREAWNFLCMLEKNKK